MRERSVSPSRSLSHHSTDAYFNEILLVGDEAACTRLLLYIFPQESVKSYEVAKEGITNHLTVVSFESGRKVLIRIYGRKSELLIDRLAELSSLKVLAGMGLAEPVYGRFRNGLVYGYVEGRPLTKADFPAYSQAIAREMARWHCLIAAKSPGLSSSASSLSASRHDLRSPLFESPDDAVDDLRRSAAMQMLSKWSDCLPSGFPDDPVKQNAYAAFDLHYLEACAEWMLTEGNVSPSPLVFCHNDLLPSNVIAVNSGKGT